MLSQVSLREELKKQTARKKARVLRDRLDLAAGTK
jgi:hypothetical protein